MVLFCPQADEREQKARDYMRAEVRHYACCGVFCKKIKNKNNLCYQPTVFITEIIIETISKHTVSTKYQLIITSFHKLSWSCLEH